MVDTCKVCKLPVHCPACGSRQYETLLRISEAGPLACVECHENIDLPHDNPAVFSYAVAFVEGERRLLNGSLGSTFDSKSRNPYRGSEHGAVPGVF